MQTIVAVVILTIVVIAVVVGFANEYLNDRFSTRPVSANLASGSVVYMVDEDTYVIPVRFTTSTDRPIGVCRVGISYMVNGVVYTDEIRLALSPSTYRNRVGFAGGTFIIENPIISGPMDVDIVIDCSSPDCVVNGIEFYYCEYGVSTEPRWSETLVIPEGVLRP